MRNGRVCLGWLVGAGCVVASTAATLAAEPVGAPPTSDSWTRRAWTYSGPGSLFVLEDGGVVLRLDSPVLMAEGAPLAYGLRTTADVLVQRADREWSLGRRDHGVRDALAVEPFVAGAASAALLQLEGELRVQTDVPGGRVLITATGGQGRFTGNFRVAPLATAATDGEFPAEDVIDAQDWPHEDVRGCSVSCGANGMCFASGRFAICFCGLTGPVCISSLLR